MTKSEMIKKKLKDFIYYDKTNLINGTICKLDNIVVNTQKKFIYLKISKTGGTTLHRRILNKVFIKGPTYFDTRSLYFIYWLEKCNNLDEYFIFSIIRNTYTRVLSLYTHNILQRKSLSRKKTSFDKFLNIYNTKNSLNNYSQLKTVTINNEIFVDYLGSFEKLNESILYILNKINVNIKHTFKIPYQKSLSIKELLNNDSKKKIYNLCKNEIDFFNFK